MEKAYNPLKFEKFAKTLNKVILILFVLFAIPTAIYVFLMFFSLFYPDKYNSLEFISPYSPSLLVVHIPFATGYYRVNTVQTIDRLYISLTYFTSILFYAFISSILCLFNKIIKSTLNKAPFSKKNIAFINAIAWMIIGYTLLIPIYHYVMSPNKNFLWLYLLGLNWGLPVAGFVMLFLAKMFERGSYLQTEYEETL